MNLDVLDRYGVSTLHEAVGQGGLLPSNLKPLQQNYVLVGRALTVFCPAGDNLSIHKALDFASQGDVLVVTTSGDSDYGMFGDLLAEAAVAAGVKGLVINSGVRDVSVLRRMRFPVWSRCVYARGTVKETVGSINQPIQIGGVDVRRGDYVVADDDGVIIIGQHDLDDVLERAETREMVEEEKRARLKAGEKSMDVFSLRARDIVGS